MKKLNFSLTILVVSFVLLLSGCGYDDLHCDISYKPVYISYEELKNSIKFKFRIQGMDFGKIYTYKNLLLVNDMYEGIHFYDNTNPSNPINLGFLQIPGNINMVVKDNILYADSFTNLVIVDISYQLKPSVITVLEKVFPYPSVEYIERSLGFETCHEPYDEEKGIVVLWTEDGTLYSYPKKRSTYKRNTNAGIIGTAGSFSNFLITGNYLFAVNGSALDIYDISISTKPNKVKSIASDSQINNIYIFNNALLIAYYIDVVSEYDKAIQIYDISDPVSPQFMSAKKFDHKNEDLSFAHLDNLLFISLLERTFIYDVSTLSEIQLITFYNANYKNRIKALDYTPTGEKYIIHNNSDFSFKFVNVTDPENIVDYPLSSSYSYGKDEFHKSNNQDVILQYDPLDMNNGLVILSNSYGVYQFENPLAYTPEYGYDSISDIIVNYEYNKNGPPYFMLNN